MCTYIYNVLSASWLCIVLSSLNIFGFWKKYIMRLDLLGYTYTLYQLWIWWMYLTDYRAYMYALSCYELLILICLWTWKSLNSFKDMYMLYFYRNLLLVLYWLLFCIFHRYTPNFLSSQILCKSRIEMILHRANGHELLPTNHRPALSVR